MAVSAGCTATSAGSRKTSNGPRLDLPSHRVRDGVPWHDSGTIGGLLGTRMVLNEFIAYAQLGPMKAQLDPVSFTIATFALCGFANISSVGIQIGGIGALVPTASTTSPGSGSGR